MPGIGRDAVVTLVVDSEALRGNLLGDPTVRRLPVYLPPQYAEDPTRRFPVAYYLAGYGGWGGLKLQEKAFEPTLVEQLDEWMQDGRVAPMLIAFPDAFTRFGGAQYRNSPAAGRVLDYLCDEVVAAVDSQLRTLPGRNHRAVLGKSSGGYGALWAVMQRPDVFGVCASTAGDAAFDLTMVHDVAKLAQQCYRHGGPETFVRQTLSKRKRSGDEFVALMVLACAQAYSPNPTVPEIWCDLPIDWQTGHWKPEVWQRWLDADPVQLVAKHQEALRSLRYLLIDAGTSDEWALDVAARRLVHTLRAHNIACEHEEFDGGHRDIDWRLESVLGRVSTRL